MHLWDTPHIVSELNHMVLIGDFRWKIFAMLPLSVKKLVCPFISQSGPLVFPSDKQKSFVRGKSV